MSATATGSERTGSDLPAHAWLILATVGIAQLMVVLDATIVNIALPSAQREVGFGDNERQWIVTAYSLAFGGLLLVGGRINDHLGRKRTFVTGLAGFALASAVGGLAPTFGILVAARAAQGVFGALLAPAALSILTVTFAGSNARAKAFGVFGAIAGAGGAIGLLLGGVLTEYLDWRWCLYVNCIFAAVAAASAMVLMRNSKPADADPVDWLGGVLVSVGLFAVVYGFASAERVGWSAFVTIGCLVGGLVLLVAFAVVEVRTRYPLLPPRVVLDRGRGGSVLSMLVAAVGMFGVFLFLTYYMQVTLGFSAVRTGLAFLPMPVTIAFFATIVMPRVVTRIGPRFLVAPGMLLASGAMAWLTTLEAHTAYFSGILPKLVLLGAGIGMIFSGVMTNATLGVDPHDAGVASATLNTAQQVGGSIGVSLLSTVSATAAANYTAAHAADAANPVTRPDFVLGAQLASYHAPFWYCAAIFLVGALVCGAILRPTPSPAGAAH
ncbi:MFS transporter [Rhodococcus sp. HNM0569]|uniref:MFS transporter n=1 Tax=Rhodococcus sp. HNM0569 TaxID=2716340 RepID=UPI00146A7822|nr:MFS transporter [Rhodococcus sp. HNM0569]NLU85112.1 MFS transporter [Rhodococcus sp. HNM0569]